MAVLDGQPISCSDTTVGLSDLRFFVSALTLVDKTGRAVAVKLQEDDRWQNSDVALLDLEDGRGHCVNGTRATNATVHGVVAPGSYVAMRFELGVPFALNHANPLLAPPPLNDPAMHWHWRSGYKFLRVGLASSQDAFWTHLGSTGCQGTMKNIQHCTAANRVAVDLPLDSDEIPDILVNLSVLIESTDLTDQLSADCSSGPAEKACERVFAAFGLAFGENTSPKKQQLFTVQQ